MSTIDGPSPDLWSDLRGAAPPTSGQFSAQELRADGVCTGAYMALGHDGTLHVFVPVEAAELRMLPVRLTGFELAERLVRLSDGPARLYLDLSSTAAYESMFSTIAKEIVELVVSERKDPRKAAFQAIRRWQTFWKRPRGAELSRGEQLGLFGEVWFLARLIHESGPEMVDRWTGPNGERHDFQGLTAHLEVKVTEKEAPIFRISTLDQLDPPSGRALGLAAIRVREETGASDGLVPAVRAVERLLHGHVAELETFRQKLLNAGYRAEREDEWDRLRLLLRNVDIYGVHDRFPRLIPASFVDGTPPGGVVRVEYDIDLSAFTPLAGPERDALLRGLAHEPRGAVPTRS